MYKLCKKLSINLTMGSEDYQKASSVMRGVLVKAVNENLESLLPRIRCDTLLVWEKKMNRLPLWMGKRMEQLLPHASLIVFKKEGHFAYFIKAFVFKELLMHFWREKYEYHTVDILSLFLLVPIKHLLHMFQQNRHRFDR